MASNAIAVVIPSPANAQFVNGEQGVGVSGAPAGGTPYFATRIFNMRRSGLFLFKVWTNGPATIKVGRNLAGLQPVLTLSSSVLLQTHLYLEKGANRVDVQLASTAGPCLFAMLLYHMDEVAYASAPLGWVYQASAPVPDIEVPPEVDTSTPVFSTLPNWASGIRERIAYLTEVMESESAREQAHLVRYHPRRTYEAEFLRKDTGRARLDAFLVGIGRREFLLPLWHEQFRVRSPMGSGSTTVVFPEQTLALREFQVGDRVFVNDGDPEVFEVLTVGALNLASDALTWAAGPTRSWPVGTRIIPMRRARVVEQAQLSAPVDRVARGGIRFELVEPDYRFGGAWGRCSPVWHFAINRADDITFAYNRKSYTFDDTVGPVSYKEPGDRALITMRSAMILRGRADVVAFRRFIDMAGGRAGRFYMPTRMSDILPVGDNIGGLTVDARLAGFSEFMRSRQDARALVAVVYNDGAPNTYRKVVDVVRVGSVERFTLEVPLPTVEMGRVERLQFMVPSRFDQDTFELTHLVDESAAVRTSVVTRSVDLAGMPDIDCYATSAPYPLGVEEVLTPSLSITAGRFLEPPGDMLPMNMALALETGELREPLRSYNELPDDMAFALSVISGAIIQQGGPHATEDGVELVSTLEITNGGLKTVLLAAEMETSDLRSNLSIESGTLL